MNLVNDISDLQHYVSKIKPDLIIIAGDRYDNKCNYFNSSQHTDLHFGGALL